MMRLGSRLLCASALTVAVACGQKGPPLPPLHLVPASPGDASVSRQGNEARVRFTVPATNLNGPGAVEIDRVEIYATTVAPGAQPPPNREFLQSKYRVGTLSIKPPPVEGEEAPPANTPPPNTPPDTRPSAGDKVTFVEKLTPEALKPAFTTPALPAVPPPPTPTAAATPAEPAPTYAVRIYAVRGLTKSGRPGQPAPRLQLPLIEPPPPPSAVKAAYSETAIALSWFSPASETPVTFNIYKVGGSDPVNAEAVSAQTYERPGLEFGTEECFAIRTLEMVATHGVESELSEPACVRPKDTFAPKTPQRLVAVAAPGVISLSWDANAEPDLAGYLVLRGEAAGGTLQPLTPSPIPATNFEDKTAQPGVRYAYAIVAVDKATPPNRSEPSARVEETAR